MQIHSIKFLQALWACHWEPATWSPQGYSLCSSRFKPDSGSTRGGSDRGDCLEAQGSQGEDTGHWGRGKLPEEQLSQNLSGQPGPWRGPNHGPSLL